MWMKNTWIKMNWLAYPLCLAYPAHGLLPSITSPTSTLTTHLYSCRYSFSLRVFMCDNVNKNNFRNPLPCSSWRRGLQHQDYLSHLHSHHPPCFLWLFPSPKNIVTTSIHQTSGRQSVSSRVHWVVEFILWWAFKSARQEVWYCLRRFEPSSRKAVKIVY